jgi:hypothetical protein
VKPPPVKLVGRVGDLVQDPLNANAGTTRGRMLVETSLRKYGFGRSVLADRQGRLIAGNKTVEAAAAAGHQKVKVVQTTGDELVVVQRTDLDLDQAEARELAIADNRASEIGLQWDVPTLQKLDAAGADPKQFWRGPEWAKLMEDANPASVAQELPEMALQPFEHHDYLMVVFTNSQDWSQVCDVLGVQREQTTIGGTIKKVGLGRVISGAKLLEVLGLRAAKPGRKK